MNLLIDKLPQTVRIGDTDYEIHSDFRVSILFELLIQDEDVEPGAKIRQALELYFPVFPEGESVEEIFSALLWFYQCGRTDKEMKRSRKLTESASGGGDDSERIYSYDYDDEYIYAAFLQQYGINLTQVDYLHWWEFRALFKALDHDCEFVKIMGYRSREVTGDMSKNERVFLNKMKAIHALPVSKKVQRETAALVEVLQNGGDVDSLLYGDPDS